MAELNLSKLSGTGISWKNLLSLVLLVAILGLGIKIVWFDTTSYLVPTSVVPVGSRLSAEKFRSVRLNLGQLGGHYLKAGKTPAGFASKTLQPNQLIATSSLSASAPETVARVVVTNKTQIGSGVHAGGEVSIWSARRLANNQFDVPKRLVAKAVVSKVIKNSAVFGGQNQQVEVLVAPLQAPAILAAMASDSPIFLVALQ